MIVNMIRKDIFETLYLHIAFAVNTDGHNDKGFAGQVSSQFWPELANTGPKELGEVLSHTISGKTFYAIVCHSLDTDGGVRMPEIIEQCLNSLDIPDDETIAIVLIGSGFVGQMIEADTFAILGGMARSKKRLVVYRR